MNNRTDKLKRYEIPLSRPCTGEILRAAVKKAVPEVGGNVEEKVQRYYAPKGTSHVQPSRIILNGVIGTFLRHEFMTESLDTQKPDYDHLVIFSAARFSKPKIDKFASILNRHIK